MIFGFTAVHLPIILVVREANHHFIPNPQKKNTKLYPDESSKGKNNASGIGRL